MLGLPILDHTSSLAVFSQDGHGKKTSLEEFPTQNRGGKGLKCSAAQVLAGAALVKDSDRVFLSGITNSICISAIEIPLLGRIGIGNLMIKNNLIKKAIKL